MYFFTPNTNQQGQTKKSKRPPEIIFFDNHTQKPYSDHSYADGQKVFRAFVLTLLAAVTIGFFLGYTTLFSDARNPISYLEHTWSSGHYMWAAGIPACTLGLFGLFLYRRKPLECILPVDNHVVFRIVSLGRNVEALALSIEHITERMDETPLFPYTIEVVVEEGQPFSKVEHLYPKDFVQFIVVPKYYKTQQGSIKKARALQYAMETSPTSDDTWIVHLDEESRPSRSMILGITQAIREEENSGKHRIGQGAIVYFRHWTQKRFWWWTLLDSARTGQDLGPFYLQARLGTSLYGFHGSWILIRNSVAKSIPGGFDLGLKGSITEDAWWCLIANAAGNKIRWVEGYLEEQSVRSFRDFKKQRGRWFYGLRLVSRYASVSWLRRLPLRLNLILWMVVWASIPFSIAHFWFGFAVPLFLMAAVSTSLGVYVAMVVSGMWVNLRLAGLGQWWRYVFMTPLQVALVPVYAMMEMYAAFVYGVCIPDRDDFHVIEK